MAEKKFKGFRTVETSDEELNEKIRQHRKKIMQRIIGALVLVVLVLVIGKLIYSIQKYDDYEVKSSVERDSTNISKFQEFSDYILEYSNDGILCMTKNGNLIWNQAFEMVSPMIETCGEYLVVYDQGGTQIFIISEEGLQKKIETTSAIQTVDLAKQGTIAVLMKENDESRIKLFDKKGNELANGKFYDHKGSIPVDIALSKDATKMAVSLIDVTGKAVSSTITFYNFGTVGQSEIDNNVGTYTFEEIVVQVHHYMRYYINDKFLRGDITTNAATKKHPLIRIVPLAVKDKVVCQFYKMVQDKSSTAGITNMGILQVPENMEKHID